MKLSGTQIIEKLNSGAKLIQVFSLMYGKYFYLIDTDNFPIYNIDKRSIPSIIKQCKKTMIDKNKFEFTIK